jgi:hypothetical protein
MKRNMDLVRQMLMQIEDSFWRGAVPPYVLRPFTAEEVRYHTHLLTEDGLIEGAAVTAGTRTDSDEARWMLTAKGHDFLDLARDEQRWNQARLIIQKVGSAPIAVWMKVLNDLLLKDLGTAS